MIFAAIPPNFWDRYPPSLAPTLPPCPLGNAGGLSGSLLWRVESRSGPLMVRAWPLDGPTGERIDQVHRWLLQADRLAWLAIPLADRHGKTWHDAAGRFWEVAPFLPGRADLDRPASRAHLAAMFAALAQVHNELGSAPTFGPSPGLIARSHELRRLIDWELTTLRAAVRFAEFSEPKWLARRWLNWVPFLIPSVIGPLEQAARRILNLQPVLRDVRPDHFLFEGDRLTGLVDFGAMGVDSVATDLARVLGEAVGRSAEHRRLALAAYEAVRLIPAADRTAIRHFEAANAVLAGARWVRWHFIEGRSFDDPDEVENGLNRALTKLDEWTRLHH